MDYFYDFVFFHEKAFVANESSKPSIDLDEVWSKKRFLNKGIAKYGFKFLFGSFLLLLLVGMVDVYWRGKVADRPLPPSNKNNYHYNDGDKAVITDDQSLAAERGSSSAQYDLGLKYLKGDENIPQDLKLALKWFRKAANKGHPYAQYYLGKMYDIDGSEERDDEEAFKWYLKSAEQGHYKAQALIGFMYQFGAGVKQDNIQAYMWYTLSGTNTKHLIMGKMSSSEIEEGDKLVKSWKVKMQFHSGYYLTCLRKDLCTRDMTD